MDAAHIKTNPLRRLVTAGQAILIEGVSANGEEFERWGQYQSRIQKVQEDSLVVSSPRRRGAMVRFHNGTDVTVYLTRFGIRLCFQAAISNPADCTPLVTHLVGMSGFRKYDRREHVRVELVAQPIDFSIKGDPGKSARSLAPLVTDISIGGIGLSCLQELSEDTRVRLILDLPKVFGRIEAMAEVRAVFAPISDNTGKRRWHMGLRFVDMDESDTERIAAFILYQQEKMRRVGSFTRFTGSPLDDTSLVRPAGRRRSPPPASPY